MNASENRTYFLRPFLPGEVALYKAIRLEALQQEPSMFGSSYEREAAFTEEQWLPRITNPNVACLGLYHGQELIGVTGIIIDSANPAEGHMVQSYIRKEHRGKRLSNMFYEVRLDWARKRKLKRLMVANRETNAAAIAANQRHGFQFTHREVRQWPDGTTGDALYYVLDL